MTDYEIDLANRFMWWWWTDDFPVDAAGRRCEDGGAMNENQKTACRPPENLAFRHRSSHPVRRLFCEVKR